MTGLWIDFQALKVRGRFEPILERYGIVATGTGSNRSAKCPFHDDRHPSLSVNVERKVFYCFGCDAKGDLLEFVARLESVSVHDAAAIVADICGIPMLNAKKCAHAAATETGEHEEEISVAQSAKRISDGDADPDSEQEVNPRLPFELTLDPTHPYLAERGITREIAEFFAVGYCCRGKLMNGRICIPIHDDRGELVAYVGRWPASNVPDHEPRYKLPRGFRKSQVLFNLHRVSTSEHIVIVEGYWSVFRLWELKVPAVALMGRSLSAMQEELLACSQARFLTLLLDGDEPGRAAANELLPRLARNWFVYRAELPDGKQPDTAVEDELCKLLWAP